MATSSLALVFFILSVIYGEIVHGCVITVGNNCGYEVTACSQSGQQNIDQYDLSAGTSQRIDLGTDCSWPSAVVYASVTGQCAVTGTPDAATDRNLANLAEFTIPGSGNKDFYDLSNVVSTLSDRLDRVGFEVILFYIFWRGISDIGNENSGCTVFDSDITDPPTDITENAYTTPMAIRAAPGCTSISCSISDIRSFCQPNNVLQTLASGALSCVNTDGTAGLGPTDGTRQFKAACPDAYSYNFDDESSTFTCATGSDYEVVFCP